MGGKALPMPSAGLAGESRTAGGVVGLADDIFGYLVVSVSPMESSLEFPWKNAIDTDFPPRRLALKHHRQAHWISTPSGSLTVAVGNPTYRAVEIGVGASARI